MSAFTVWSEVAVAVREPLETTVVNALSSATVQLTSVSGPTPEPGYRRGGGRHPGPQQDAVRERVAGGDAVQEGGGVRGGAGWQGGGERAGQDSGRRRGLDDRDRGAARES